MTRGKARECCAKGVLSSRSSPLASCVVGADILPLETLSSPLSNGHESAFVQLYPVECKCMWAAACVCPAHCCRSARRPGQPGTCRSQSSRVPHFTVVFPNVTTRWQQRKAGPNVKASVVRWASTASQIAGLPALGTRGHVLLLELPWQVGPIGTHPFEVCWCCSG